MKLKLALVILVVVAVGAVVGYFFPWEMFLCFVVSYMFLVMLTLGLGWGHRRLSVRGYAWIILFWELFCVYLFYESAYAQRELLVFVLSFLPLTPLWFLMYKEK